MAVGTPFVLVEASSTGIGLATSAEAQTCAAMRLLAVFTADNALTAIGVPAVGARVMAFIAERRLAFLASVVFVLRNGRTTIRTTLAVPCSE